MKHLLIACLLAGCVGPEPVDTDEVEASVTPLVSSGHAGQGSTLQGSTLQGATPQGSTLQGSTLQSSTLDGGAQGGVAVSEAAVRRTALEYWKRIGSPPPSKNYYWEHISPTQRCKWNPSRTQLLEPCTTYPLSNSPVIGSTWPTTFVRGTETLAVTLRVEAVRYDDHTYAMHPLLGADYANGGIIAYGQFFPTEQTRCENPRGCRRNSDIFNYDVKVIDVFDKVGQNPWLCPSGQTAIALAGMWDVQGTYAQSAAKFTFACTNGVIAKCTRWGYRPFDRAIRANDPSAAKIELRDYHQTCVRAAMADYCGKGYSFTKDGTLVDIYDYELADKGFIPPTKSSAWHAGPVTAFGLEGWFDQLGAVEIDTTRYQELASNPSWSPGSVCPGKFYEGEFARYTRSGPRLGPAISVQSAPMCAHSEQKTGKWLHRACSTCTYAAPAYCTDPTDWRGWDQGCVNWAQTNAACTDTVQRMGLHSECTTGASLQPYDSGCTVRVCDVNNACCNGSWSQTCVDLANNLCTGGGEKRPAFGFCNPALVIEPPVFPPVLN